MTGSRAKFRELFGHCLRSQWKLILQAGWLCHGTRAVAVSWVAGLLPGSPGRAGGGGPACWAATQLGGRETKLVYSKLGAILNTVQGSLLPYTSRTHTHTHTHTQGCTMGPPMWPWRCGLMARPVSGVEEPPTAHCLVNNTKLYCNSGKCLDLNRQSKLHTMNDMLQAKKRC